MCSTFHRGLSQPPRSVDIAEILDFQDKALKRCLRGSNEVGWIVPLCLTGIILHPTTASYQGECFPLRFCTRGLRYLDRDGGEKDQKEESRHNPRRKMATFPLDCVGAALRPSVAMWFPYAEDRRRTGRGPPLPLTRN